MQMRKRLLVLGILFLVIVLLVGCSDSIILLPPIEEIPVELIREYTGRDNVERWADGLVSVCDITKQTGNIWVKINKIIDGPVIFKLTDDTMASIGVEYLDNTNEPFVSGGEVNNCEFMWFGIGINPASAQTAVYEQVCLMAAGIKKEKAAEGFSSSVKKVLYWLYRLELGYSLLM